MPKFARIVFEEEFDDTADDEEILNRMENALYDFISNRWGIDDIEIHKNPYNTSSNRLKLEIAQVIDTVLYIPLKLELKKHNITHSLGILKENLKQTIEDIIDSR